MNEKEMNQIVEMIWNNNIFKRFQKAEIRMEMDLQAIFHSELDRKLKKNPFWRCYHDLSLLKESYNERYDLVLFNYPDIETDGPKSHYPSIVIEFKDQPDSFNHIIEDLIKLDSLFNKKKYPINNNGFTKHPFACHLMYILSVGKRSQWEKKLSVLRDIVEFPTQGNYTIEGPIIKKIENKEALTLYNLIIEYSQIRRYRGKPYFYCPEMNESDYFDYYFTRITLKRR